MSEGYDLVIIGSGIGGATLACSLADTGARILVLERGERLQDTQEARDDAAIFRRGFYQSQEAWLATDGETFLANNYYCVGGNSKFFGAVMFRYRSEDFAPRAHMEGSSPGWPLSYDDLEPWYGEAEHLFQVRGSAAQDPTEPRHSGPYPFPPVPDEPAIDGFRKRLARAGVHPFSLPLAIDIDAWLRRGKTGWDAFPSIGPGKIDAENGPLARALEHPNVTLRTGAQAIRLETDVSGKAVVAAIVRTATGEQRIAGRRFAVAAGAVQSAALLLRSAGDRHPNGLANGSDQVGRNFMNHNTTALIAVDPFTRNDSVYQKTLSFNDFYNSDPETGFPLGNVQLLGRVTGNILRANVPALPGFVAQAIANRSFAWFLSSEDLPNPESRVMVRDGEIVMNWIRSNMRAHNALIDRTRKVMRRAGFPIVLTRTFGRKTTSHQCGTARLGLDPRTSVVDVDCRSHDVANLYVTDASVLPTSAAVNPSLTVAALALKAGSALRREFGA